MATKEKLAKQVKKLSAYVIELKDEILKGKEIVVEIIVKLEATEKRAEKVG